MSLVSSRVGLRHRVTIERDANAGDDGAWGAGDPDWQEHLVDVPARAWSQAAREPVDDNKTVTYEDRRIIVPLGTDVTERDRVLRVTDAAGNEIFEGPMQIEGVLPFPDHLEILVQRQR